MTNRLLAPFALIILGSAPAIAQVPRILIQEVYDPTRKKDKTELRVTPLFDQLPASGYFPVRVYIFNDAKTSRTWDFSFTSEDSSYTDDGNQMRSSFSVSCESAKDTEVDLLVPVVTAFQAGYSSTTLEIAVDAPAPLPTSRNSLTTFYDESWPSTLISEVLNNRNRGTLATEVGTLIGGGRHGYGTTAGVEFGAAFSPKQLPEDWRAYTGYDACLLTEDEWSQISSGARNALLKWNRLGGSLVIYTANASTTFATLNIDKSTGGRERTTTRGWGQVVIDPIGPGGLLDAKETVELVATMLPGDTGANRLRNLRNDFRSGWPLQLEFGSVTANIVFFILILIAFGVLVGPINLFVFAKAGQRHRLFITTPLISLGASALLVVLILFQDGFGGRGIRTVLMEIGPNNTAYLSQEQVARTGVLLNTSFTTAESGYLTPVMIDESRWARVTQENQGGKGRYNVDVRDDGLRVTGDWFKSRSEHGHLFETIRPTRAGLSLIGSSGPPVINSSFEFPLETVFYLDPDGAFWTGDSIQQGRNTTLAASTQIEFDSWLNAQQLKFSLRNKRRIDLTRLRPGSYFAVTSEAPGLETLSAISWKKTNTLITGAIAAP